MKFVKILLVLLMGYSTANAVTIKPSQVDDIQRVIDSAQGDIDIYLEEGSYVLNKRIFLKRNKSRITITGIPYKTIIDGSNIANTKIDKKNGKQTTWAGLIDIEQGKDIEISGLYIYNSHFAGIFIHENSKNITISNIFTENTYSSGIGVWESKNIYIYGNEITKACNHGGQESITIADSSEVEVIGNEVYNNGYTVLDGNDFGGEGIDVKEGSSDVTVKDNYIHDLTDRIGIYIDAWNKNSHTIYVANNRVENNGNAGIAVASECGGNINEIVISGNTITGNAYAGIHIAGYTNPECKNKIGFMSNFFLENNIIKNNGKRSREDNDDGGAFNISNLNISNLHIANNTFSNNYTKLYTALAYNGIEKRDSQISSWSDSKDVQIEPGDKLHYYIYDNKAM